MNWSPIILLLGASLVTSGLCFGQLEPENRFAPKTAKKVEAKETYVSMEVVLPQRVFSGVDAQEWGRELNTLKIPVRIRQAIRGDKPGVSEQMLGRLRQVKLVGQLGADGRISFGGKQTYSLEQIGELRKWVQELKEYGAQGAPEGQPVWGLSQAQFEALHLKLRTPVDLATNSLATNEFVARMVRQQPSLWKMTPAAIDVLEKTDPIQEELQGLSVGTVMSAVLRKVGMAFAPVRSGEGDVVLQIDVAQQIPKPWPIGWDLETANVSRLKAAPQLFQMSPVELNNAPFPQVVRAVAAKSKLPILVDSAGIKATGEDFDTMVVNFPRKRTSWSLLLKTITIQKKLKYELLIDEAGRPFVWIEAFQPVAGKP